MKHRPDRALHAEERLDAATHDPAILEHSLGQIAAVNRWLGGWRALLRHLPALLADDRTTRILDIATGSGDGPIEIARWARRARRSVEISATDIHPQMLEVARRRAAPFPEVRVEAADALELPFAEATFDAAILTLALHHFEGDAQVRALREMGRVARWVVVGELERSWPNYAGAKLMAWTLWRGNPLTRHDGPLSVLRAYTPDELFGLARAAGLVQPRIYRHAFERLMLVAGGTAEAALPPE